MATISKGMSEATQKFTGALLSDGGLFIDVKPAKTEPAELEFGGVKKKTKEMVKWVAMQK